jgi:lipopolysaccharide export system protein LptA
MSGALQVIAAAALAAMFAAVLPLGAQPAQQTGSGPPNALQGFSQNRDQPIKINSATLEVRDKDKMATFTGDVHLVQGDTTLRSNVLVVFYDNDQAPATTGSTKATSQKPAAPKPAASPANSPPSSTQQIRRVEAKGDVIVVQKDQTATGDNGVFEMRANTVTLVGNVVISQGQNVVKGDRLTVDMTTGVSRVECGKTATTCRVQALIQPNAIKTEPHPGEAGSSHEGARQRGQQPSGLY